ncbi:Virulence-associated cell-wall-anchored protein SasG (LPXTG motif), binding to squamous nasal epithelial cells [Staphylococcus aureus]|nr:Virulence-associated cell-wall-anchored protein SasG (LPXTG motif), binding to squamous nasal epithelial cells [Staphylococcus aureus]SUL74891.1 Virulence-associated cell-wall-anchored protein SasG (LPXTG motif), binding to squamous nasal epithelial cells [Staphylococcus aureus]
MQMRDKKGPVNKRVDFLSNKGADPKVAPI